MEGKGLVEFPRWKHSRKKFRGEIGDEVLEEQDYTLQHKKSRLDLP